MGPIMPQLLVIRCVAPGRWIWLSITTTSKPDPWNTH